MIQSQHQLMSQYPQPGIQMSPYTPMYHPLIIQNVQSQPSPVFNQPQYHQFPTMNEQRISPVSSLSLPLMVAHCPTTNPQSTNNIAAASSTSTDETWSNVSSVSSIPTLQTHQIVTPTLLPYNPMSISPGSTGLCSPNVVSMDNVQTAWIAPGSSLGYAPQARLYSSSPAPFVPYAQPLYTTSTTPPPMSYEAIFHNPPPAPTGQNNVQQQPHHFSSPQSNRTNSPSPPRSNLQYQQCHNIFPEGNVKKSTPNRHFGYNKNKGRSCVPVSMSRNKKNFRVRCKACSAPVSRQVVKEVQQEDLQSAFADQNEILDQLPEFFGEPLLNFPEIVFYMQIFKARSKGNEELQYFKVPRPAKERELHIDHRLTELFIRNFGFDHACEHHEFQRLPMHVPGICHARNLYRHLIVEALLPTFLAYVRHMDEAKRLFGIIFRYVGCATPKDIASNLPQVWKAVTNVDADTSLEITGIVSLYNYHLFRRLIEKEN